MSKSEEIAFKWEVPHSELHARRDMLTQFGIAASTVPVPSRQNQLVPADSYLTGVALIESLALCIYKTTQELGQTGLRIESDGKRVTIVNVPELLPQGVSLVVGPGGAAELEALPRPNYPALSESDFVDCFAALIV